MSSIRLAVVVGALLLVAPSTLALVGGETNLDVDGPVSALALQSQRLGETPSIDVDTLADTVDGTLDPIAGLIECRQAVRVPVAILWGDITDTRTEAFDVRVERTVEALVDTVQVPIVSTVTQTLWEPSGLLGFLKPVTRTVQEVTGYEVKEVFEDRTIDLDVHLRFRGEYHEHGGTEFPIQLALPVGLPFLTDQTGELVTVCDGSDILPQIPAFPDRDGHDFYKVCIGCNLDDPSAYDGWVTRVLSSQVALGAADGRTPEALQGCWLFSSRDILAAAGLAADNYVAGLDSADIPALSGSGGSEADAHETHGASASALTGAGAGTTALVGSVLASLAAVAVAGAAWLRRP